MRFKLMWSYCKQIELYEDLHPLECAHAGRTLGNDRASLSAVVRYATLSFLQIHQSNRRPD